MQNNKQLKSPRYIGYSKMTPSTNTEQKRILLRVYLKIGQDFTYAGSTVFNSKSTFNIRFNLRKTISI